MDILKVLLSVGTISDMYETVPIKTVVYPPHIPEKNSPKSMNASGESIYIEASRKTIISSVCPINGKRIGIFLRYKSLS